MYSCNDGALPNLVAEHPASEEPQQDQPKTVDIDPVGQLLALGELRRLPDSQLPGSEAEGQKSEILG